MIGIDILETERVKNFANNIKLLKSVFLESEIEYIKDYNYSLERIAGFFCAKEAVMKALSCPKNITFLDIEIKHYDNKQPYVKLHKIALEKFNENNYKNIEISISHTKTVATAICNIN